MYIPVYINCSLEWVPNIVTTVVQAVMGERILQSILGNSFLSFVGTLLEQLEARN